MPFFLLLFVILCYVLLFFVIQYFMKIDTNSTILYDFGGDTSKRWRISFKVFDHKLGELVRRCDYSMNRFQDAAERYEYSENRIIEINALLRDGFAVNVGDTRKFLSIEDAFNEMLEVKILNYAKRTKDSIISSLAFFLSYMEEVGRLNDNIKTISKLDFLNYRDWLLRSGRSARTANNYVGYANSLLNEMAERGVLEKNPCVGLKKLRSIDTMKNREISPFEMVPLKKELAKEPDLYLFVKFVYYCWLRPREITFLRVKDLDLRKGVVKLQGENTKDKTFAFVHIPAAFLSDLKKITFPLNGDLLIFARDGVNGMFGALQFNENRFSKRHSELRDKLKLSKDIKLYSWKRSGVCSAYRRGSGVFELMKHGRWSDLDQVKTYLEKSGLSVDDKTIKIENW